MCTWRFVLAALPLVFFVPCPDAPWRILIGCGVAIAVMHLGLMFIAIANGMPAELSSLLVPVSEIAGTALACGERLDTAQALGAVLDSKGLALTVFGPELFRMLRTRIDIQL